MREGHSEQGRRWPGLSIVKADSAGELAGGRQHHGTHGKSLHPLDRLGLFVYHICNPLPSEELELEAVYTYFKLQSPQHLCESSTSTAGTSSPPAPVLLLLQRVLGERGRRSTCSLAMEEEGKGSSQRQWSYIVGAASSSLSTLATFPVYKTIFRQQLHAFSVTAAVRQLRHEGFCQIYRGVFPPLLAKTLQGMLMFGTYNSFHGLLSSCSLRPSTHRATAGLLSGLAEAVVFCPFERVQNVLQDGRKVQRFPTARHILWTFCSSTPKEGFYRGLGLILIRNGLGSSLYFALEEPLRKNLPRQGLPSWAQSFASGSACGIAVCLLLYPLGILIAHVQCQVGRQETFSLQATMTEVWRARGGQAWLLYRGGSLLILRSSLTWGLTTAIYHFLSNATG